MEGIMAEGKAYYKDYDVEIPETLSAYGYGDSPLTFVSLSDYKACVNYKAWTALIY